MSRTLLNIIIDILAALSFVGMIATGYLLRFPLPPGSNKTHMLWGLTRHQWGDIHFWISLALLLIMLVHLALHWNWIVTVIGKRCGLVKTTHPSLVRCATWTVVVFVAICAGFVWLVDISVEQIAYPGKGHRFGARRHQAVSAKTIVHPEAESDNEALSWRNIYPILEKNCLACHGPDKQWAGFRVDQVQDFFKPEAAWVVAEQPEQSPLLAIVSGKRSDMAMAEVHRLPDADVARIKAWIEQGAKQ